MIPPAKPTVPLPAPPDAAMAAVALARAKLVALALQAGQVVEAKVLGRAANGLTQLAIAGHTFNVKLPAALPAGATLQVQVQAGTGTSQPQLLVMQPPPPATPSPPLPAAPVIPVLSAATPPPVPLPQPAPAMPGPAAASPSGAGTAPPPQLPGALPPVPTAPSAAPVAPPPSSTAPPPPLAASPALVAAGTAPPAPAFAPATAIAPPTTPPGPPGAANPATLSPILATNSQTQHHTPSPPPPVAPPPVGSPASAALGLATQAAARQDSIAPLLQNLVALQGRMGELPRPVAEAALRLLAGRLVVGNPPPGASALKQAIVQSGIFASPPSALVAPAATDLRSALLSLRGALMRFLGTEIEPVAPVSRRPPPPTRDAQPRAMRSDPPTLPEGANSREAGRTLLHQTDAALSRLRLLQLASQPLDAGRAGAPNSVTDWTLEVPMLLGHELAVAQLRISRDAEGRDPKRDRHWQLRFSVNFSILGEVGAQVGLDGKAVSIALWAEEPATATTLEEMLPELGPALAARGLEVGTLRVGRGAPDGHRPRVGQFMDHLK